MGFGKLKNSRESALSWSACAPSHTALLWVRMPIATITSKGQVTIPLEVRERLGLKTGDEINFELGPEGEVVLTSKRIPFEEIEGMLHRRGEKPLTAREMDQPIRRAAQSRWKRENRRAK